MVRILLLEDDEKLRRHLTSAMESAGYIVHQMSNLSDLEYLKSTPVSFNVLVLDRLIGQQDSKDSLSSLKQRWPSAAVLIVSAVNTPAERTELLNLGADDYIGKPFSTSEVVARVNALLRRVGASASHMMSFGNTVIDSISRQVIVEGRSCMIPAKEFLVLRALGRSPGRVFNKSDLLDLVWGSNFDLETNVVEATIANLRRRLQEIESNMSIKSARNMGYWLES